MREYQQKRPTAIPKLILKNSLENIPREMIKMLLTTIIMKPQNFKKLT